MINRYTYKDPLFKGSTPNKFLRVESDNPILTIYRLISGTVDCSDSFSGKKYNFRTNYCYFPYKENERIIQSTILNVMPEEIRIGDLNLYFKRSRFNTDFYKLINAELIKCLVATKEDRHLEAFFYLYRIIEGICYSIPLIYVSKNKKYTNSYNQLKSFFSNNESGELSFFRKFIEITFNKEDFYQLTIDVEFSGINIDEIREKYFMLYTSKMESTQRGNKKSEFVVGENSIEVSFIGFYDLLIVIRNRFFHFTQGAGKENIKSTDVIYPDYFFKPIIHHGINWVSIIILELIKFDFEKGSK